MRESNLNDWVYNIKAMDYGWRFIKIFVGEGGTILQTGLDSLIYTGGFLGSKYNKKVGHFRLA